eukprot:Partr_v1_DN26764_c0_g1_i4_m8754 putative nicotinamide
MKLDLPSAVLTDSYKLSHYELYPKAKKMVAYGEFRQAFDKDVVDTRIVCHGIRYIIENYIDKRWTVEQVEKSSSFFATHNAGYRPFPFPKELFLKFIRENDGYFPVKIEACPEGSVVYPHVPIYQITAEGEYSALVTYLESLLTMIWYPSTVATLSRRAKHAIHAAFVRSVDPSWMFLLDSRLHDFGFRGCTSVEQTVIGGCAHLLNFTGSDTMSASYYAQYHLNDGKPVGNSIPATEHSVMTAWPSEREAMDNLIEHYGEGVFACVMDSYDYSAALEKLLPSIASHKLSKGGLLVLRPDSGDPVDTVLMALRASEKVFGVTTNSLGYKVVNGCGVIQGDGISIKTIHLILDAALKEKYSAQNIAFGMGAGLLQKVNRDTMSFATKLCMRQDHDGHTHDIMKMPKTDTSKFSLPGELAVVSDEQGQPRVYPKEQIPKSTTVLMETVYDNGKNINNKWQTFDQLRERVEKEWLKSPPHPTNDVISKELHAKIEKTRAGLKERLDSTRYYE